MNWFFLTLLSVVISSLANILQRVLMRSDKSDPVAYATVFHFLIGSISLIFALLHGFQPPTIGWSLVYFFIAAALWGTGTIFLFKALQLLESSEVTILTSSKVLITIMASLIFLHEVFNLQKAVGACIILVSILLVSNVRRGITLSRGMIYAFVTALLYGSAVFFDVLVVKNYDPISYLAAANILVGLLLFIVRPGSLRQWRTFTHPEFIRRMLPLGVLSSTQAVAYYYALKIGPLSQIASINQSGVIVTMIFAIVLLKERDRLSVKILAAILVTLGIVLLR